MRKNQIHIRVTAEVLLELLQRHCDLPGKALMAKEPVSMAVDNDFQILSLVAQGPEVGTTAAEGGSLYYTSLVTLKSIKECACEQYQ